VKLRQRHPSVAILGQPELKTGISIKTGGSPETYAGFSSYPLAIRE
jgi:hypothetical protein